MKSSEQHRPLRMGQVRVSAAYLLVLPLLVWPVWTYISAPNTISPQRVVAIIASIAGPILIIAAVILLKLRTEHKRRSKYLESQGFVPAGPDRTRNMRDALREEIRIPNYTPGRGVKCWHRHTEAGEECFTQYTHGSGRSKRRMFAVKIPAARTRSSLYWNREGPIGMHLQRRIFLTPPVGPAGFAKRWVVSGPPAVTDTLFTDGFCRLIDDAPFGRHQAWIWRYDQLWFIGAGLLTAEGIQAGLDLTREAAHAAGITTHDAHGDWWTDLIAPIEVTEPPK